MGKAPERIWILHGSDSEGSHRFSSPSVIHMHKDAVEYIRADKVVPEDVRDVINEALLAYREGYVVDKRIGKALAWLDSLPQEQSE